MATTRDGSRERGAQKRRSGNGGESGSSRGPIEGRERPINADAEKGVLGSILIKPDVCDDVALVVRVEDFADEAHQILYRHLVELHDGGKRIDATIVLERLRSKGDADRIGGAAFLAEVLESVPHAAHAVHYAQIVRDKSLLRSLIDAGTDILRNAYDETDEPRQLLAQAEERSSPFSNGARRLTPGRSRWCSKKRWSAWTLA